MKKIYVLAIVAMFAFVASVNTAKAQKNVIKVNLFSVAASTGSFFYERALNDKSALQLGFAYTGASASGTKYRGYQGTLQYNYYVTADAAPRGFYLGPFVRYRSLSISADYTDYDFDTDTYYTTEAKATWNQVGGGVVVGYQWLFGDRVAFSPYLGPAYYSNSFDYKDGSSEDQFSLKGAGGFSFRTGLTLGVAF